MNNSFFKLCLLVDQQMTEKRFSIIRINLLVVVAVAAAIIKNVPIQIMIEQIITITESMITIILDIRNVVEVEAEDVIEVKAEAEVIVEMYALRKNLVKTVKSKLEELCSKFDDSILNRSRRVREKQGLPIESTQIPDYRQLLMTNKFDKFSRCKCDHKTEDNKPGKCAQHNRKSRNKQSKQNESDKSSSSSRNSSTSSSSSNSSSYSSSSFSSSNSKSSKTKTKKSKEKENDDNDDEFEDIRSMEIDRKQKHPERLHPDLSFNEPDQVIFISVYHSKIYLNNYMKI